MYTTARGSMTTKTVSASEERGQGILGAVCFSPQGRGVEGNDQLYMHLGITLWTLDIFFTS